MDEQAVPAYYNTKPTQQEAGLDLNFVDPAEVPVPPDQVRVRRVELKPLADGRRLQVAIELTPFIDRPSLEVAVEDAAGVRVAETSIIETIDHQLAFTLHLRQPPEPGLYALQIEVGYEVDEPVDRREVRFELG